MLQSLSKKKKKPDTNLLIPGGNAISREQSSTLALQDPDSRVNEQN